jgi:hypothetical protein
MHREDGSPLPLGEQLCRRTEPEAFHPVYVLHRP